MGDAGIFLFASFGQTGAPEQDALHLQTSVQSVDSWDNQLRGPGLAEGKLKRGVPTLGTPDLLQGKERHALPCKAERYCANTGETHAYDSVDFNHAC
jgi:hypothetical protein